jgi:uncharacterized protein YbjT (DUF2867 family)
MAKATILVTGAAGGGQGATGNLVTRMLLQKGVPVRAFVHRADERSAELNALGAEIVEGDFLDIQSVREAFAGIRRAYFAYPVQSGLLDATAIFASAAREAGVELLVNLSQLLPRPEQPTPHQRRHWLSEQIFDWANVGAVHLDASVFYQNLRALVRGSLSRSDMILLPWGPETTTIPMIAGEDVARVAVGVLTGSPMPNGTILPLVGEVVTLRNILDAFSDVLGRQVQYREITDDEWAQAASGAGINADAVAHLSSLWRYLRTRSSEQQGSYQVSALIEQIGGAPPKTLREFLGEQAHLFAR